MALSSVFDIIHPGLFHGVYAAQVTDVADREGTGRVQVRLLSCDGFASQDSLIWARVAVPFSGSNYGAYFIPNVNDEVLVAFLNGDPRFPIVIGSLWHGNAKAPETLPGQEVDRWTITGKEGSRIAIVETSAADAKITLTTPGSISGEFTAAGGGKIELKTPSGTVKIEQSGITIETQGNLTVRASQVDLTAGQVNVNSAMAVFSGTVQCTSLMATSVVSGSYSPGAGNVW